MWLDKIHAKRAEILRDTRELSEAKVRRSTALYDEASEATVESVDAVGLSFCGV